MKHQAQIPPVVLRYFGPNTEHPIIEQVFTPGKGWKRYPIRKRISRAWVHRHLRPEGVEKVALRANGRLADFHVKELMQA